MAKFHFLEDDNLVVPLQCFGLVITPIGSDDRKILLFARHYQMSLNKRALSLFNS